MLNTSGQTSPLLLGQFLPNLLRPHLLRPGSCTHFTISLSPCIGGTAPPNCFGEDERIPVAYHLSSWPDSQIQAKKSRDDQTGATSPSALHFWELSSFPQKALGQTAPYKPIDSRPPLRVTFMPTQRTTLTTYAIRVSSRSQALRPASTISAKHAQTINHGYTIPQYIVYVKKTIH